MVSSSTTPGQNQGPLGNEIKNMISTLSRHINSINSSSSSSSSSQQEQGHGNGIITLAGSNRGATMKSDMEHEVVETHGVIYGDDERLSAYTNSNYQSINNSIVLNGSYTAEDPGIHLVISDFMEEHEDDHLGKHGNKGKRDDEG
ncbi:hypothetical protein J5N97_025464 [Dioscorea zingiberensis]|uniref:Uncharacterized protein n=1 Tax=Dioscorea zingiberensis TaxID=325984 RepID=A0A9D5C9I9_9LILI|nr:hypothetical protein J5N97_025464 [Dioscorea zingiberensis]